ncbi:MAG TPA: NUDIX domain-containing protein [Micromonosporaceae bacterium]|jgi:8-oxo-dGTP diphosphatase
MAAARDVRHGKPDATPGHEVLAVVLQVRGGVLSVLLWQRARPPHRGKWALPGGVLGGTEDLGPSIRRQLAAKVDVRELSHLEQLDTRGQVDRHPDRRVIATAYLGLVPADLDPDVPQDTTWHPVDRMPPMAYDHAAIVAAGRERLRSKLSYTNLGFALAPPDFTISQLRGYYSAALGHEVSATNLQRVLLRRRQIEPTGRTAPPGPYGGRPAELFRFRERRLEITDGFAVLRPPTRPPDRPAVRDPGRPPGGTPRR